jgi:hypothetical protein
VAREILVFACEQFRPCGANVETAYRFAHDPAKRMGCPAKAQRGRAWTALARREQFSSHAP